MTTISSSKTKTLSSKDDGLILTGTSAINGTGNAKSNTIFGNDAANTLDGKGGADYLFGGLGNDIYIVDNSGDVITEDSTLEDEIDVVASSISFDLSSIENVEGLILTGSAKIDGTGNDGINSIIGNSKDNTIDGKAGDDTLNGKAGNDSILGGDGNDTILGGDGNDTISGGSGDDSIIGGKGNDNLTGGDGNDTFTVDNGKDTITDFDNGDVLTVSKGATATITIAQDLYFTNFEATSGFINDGTVNLIISGRSTDLHLASGKNGFSISNDASTDAVTINGSSKNDSITGGSADDTIIGGSGNDILTGGEGDDYFGFDALPNAKTNLDKIIDFGTGNDKLVFSTAIFTTLTSTSPEQFSTITSTEFLSNKTGKAEASNDHLIYNYKSGALYYDVDGNGSGKAVQIALIGAKAHPGITAADILIYEPIA